MRTNEMESGTHPHHRPIGHQIVDFGEEQIGTITRNDAIDRIAKPLQAALVKLFSRGAGKAAQDFLNGTWLGHPLHPVLTDVPLGAWTAVVAMDGLSAAGVADLDEGARAAQWIGIAGAVGAALTGIADWTDTTKEQRRVGLIHAALNSTALLLQIGSVVRRGRRQPGAKALSLLGFATAATAAYLGGNLVYRLGTQVDRAAWAGGLRDFTPALQESELPPERPTRVEVEGVPVLLVRKDEVIYAMEDTCGHAGCPLSQGSLEGECIVCPCHGSTYRLRDGAVIHGPSPFPQPTFDVRVDNRLIQLKRRPIA